MNNKNTKKQEKSFIKQVFSIAIPVALQCMLQSSFSIVDQLMIGQLGETSIAAIGLAGKFYGIFTVILGAISTVLGITISQYLGKKSYNDVSKSFSVNTGFGLILAVLFTLLTVLFPEQIMSIYTKEVTSQKIGASYLVIISLTYLMAAFNFCFSTFLRCLEKAMLPLYATIIASIVNTVLNYLLILGKAGFPALQEKGAAIATVVSQAISLIIILIGFFAAIKKENLKLKINFKLEKKEWKNLFSIALPLFICELLWVLGENIYAVIYGHLGNNTCAAMTLSYPVQGFMIGALSGLSSAAGIIIGKSLGSGETDKAYLNGKKFIFVSLIFSMLFSLIIILLSDFYINIYNVNNEVKVLGKKVLFVFAIFMIVKVQNMVLAGGVIRSGGNTRITMWIDIIGTWLFGVPLGLLSAFVLQLPIYVVYGILSMEEVVRLLIAIVVFKKKIWIKTL